MPGLLEEVKKINRTVPELAISDDNDVVDVKPGNGKVSRAVTLT